MNDKTDLDDYLRSPDHYRHAVGAPQAPEIGYYNKRLSAELGRATNRAAARVQADRAWTVMLFKQGIINKPTALQLLRAIDEVAGDPAYNAEWSLKKELPEDVASFVNLGRTTQEPMERMIMREKLLDVLGLLLKAREATLDPAEEHAETVMAGHTHMSHAQATTYAAYLLSVHDVLARATDQLETAWAHTNLSSAGCGALSGTGRPTDRRLVAELLGFDGLVEVAYACEVGMDHTLSILFGVANVMVLLTQVAMDLEFWSAEEVGMMRIAPGWLEPSSLMPQKAHPGGQLEWLRVAADHAIGAMTTAVLSLKSTPHTENLPIGQGWTCAVRGMCWAEKALGFFVHLLPAVTPDKARMLEYAREGYSCTTDLAVKLIRDRSLGPRRAHRICATFVRLARERGIKACDATGELLDDAARFLGERPPDLATEEVREALDPVQFVRRHDNVGDPHPDESRRMVAARRQRFAEAQNRHAARVKKLEDAGRKLDAAVAEILG